MIPTETPLQTEVGESWKPHRRTDQQLRMGGEGEGRCCISGEKFHRADRAHENVHPVLFSVSEFVEQIFKRAGRPSPSELAEVNRYLESHPDLYAISRIVPSTFPRPEFMMFANGNGRSILFLATSSIEEFPCFSRSSIQFPSSGK